MKSLILVTLVCSASISHAASYVSCGSGATSEQLPFFEVPEIQVASEDDLYQGAVGGSWELKLANQSDWMKPNLRVKALTSKDDKGATFITISLIRDVGLSPVGLRYVLTGLYDEKPVLTKFAEGGFAGGAKIGEFSCVSVID